MELKMEKINPYNDAKKLYPIYFQLHQMRKQDPSTFDISRCNKILTGLMGGHSWSWHVIGITELALQKFKDLDYRYVVGSGITRAHLKPRVETVKEVIDASAPLNVDAFVKFWLNNDKTVLCAKGENKFEAPVYIEFDNTDYNFFQSGNVGWKHSKKEIDFLKTWIHARSATGLKDLVKTS